MNSQSEHCDSVSLLGPKINSPKIKHVLKQYSFAFLPSQTSFFADQRTDVIRMCETMINFTMCFRLDILYIDLLNTLILISG